MQSHLAELDTPEGLAALVAPGMRAISIEIDSAAGLKGMLKPGARVDIVATVSAQSDTIAKTIAQDIVVLAVGGEFRDAPKATTTDEEDPYKNPEERGRDITLMVTPEQAARIDLAFTQGRPRLVLRGGGDRELSPFTGLTLAQLLGQDKGLPEGQDPWNPPYEDDGFDWNTETAGTEPDSDSPVVINKSGGQVVGSAGIDTGLVESPGTNVSSAEGSDAVDAGKASTVEPAAAKPTPAVRPAPRPRPVKPKTVEIIRGGVSSVEVVPPQSKKKSN